MQEAAQDALALPGMGNLGMKLHAVKSARLVRHPGQRRVVGPRNHAKTGGQFIDPVAVAHPDIEQRRAIVGQAILDIAEQA